MPLFSGRWKPLGGDTISSLGSLKFGYFGFRDVHRHGILCCSVTTTTKCAFTFEQGTEPLIERGVYPVVEWEYPTYRSTSLCNAALTR